VSRSNECIHIACGYKCLIVVMIYRKDVRDIGIIKKKLAEISHDRSSSSSGDRYYSNR
jgi:hypothetical protein